jgi:hypothetical protein
MSYQDEMRRRAEQGFAPGWQPARGDEIVGVVEDVDHVNTSKFSDYEVVTVRRIINDKVTDERVAIHCFHTSLRTSMQRKWPNPGGVLFLRYVGTKHNDRTDQDFEAYDYAYDAFPPEHLRIKGYEQGGAGGSVRQGSPAPARAGNGEEPF